MRQILCKSNGALVARMPRPAVEAGSVLVRVHYSLISVGTEIASLRPAFSGNGSATRVQRTKASVSRAPYYLRAAFRDPSKALRHVAGIAKQTMADVLPRNFDPPAAEGELELGDLQWTRCAAISLDETDHGLELTTDDSECGYQIISQGVEVPAGRVLIIRIQGTIHNGAISVGLLNDDKSSWLGARNFEAGPIDDRLVFDPQDCRKVWLVICTAGAGVQSQVTLDAMSLRAAPPMQDGLPQSELDDQGWNVGYSVAGEVIAVGEGINDIAPGDWVACGGAGQANHADFVNVGRNLVCRIPPGCSPQTAATTTVGTIALQGVRRAQVQLGETVCVIGLGLIGQITSQLLRAAGCKVVGLDLDPSRVAKAEELGMEAGADDPQAFHQLVRDLTGGHGVDRTLITAATASDAVINMAMQVTRRKGTVVIVGDVGLSVERTDFYRKEIDLLMSTSYGPGRYDRSYEQQGRDYPFAYVRWTLNRNMQSYLDMIAGGRLNIDALLDRVVPIDQAPEVYRELAAGEGPLPLGVLISYPEEERLLPEAFEATAITIRGHRIPPKDRINFALVGAGAFGTCMLVPQMQKRSDRFFLRGVVSRDTTRGGNFARANRVEVFTTELETVLQDPGFDLVVIATRHDQHAQQVVAGLEAGKHVFVEKPLALSWEELDRVVETYRSLETKPLLMVGFNRRFSPAIKRLRVELQQRRSPVIINYRLNGGYIPLDSWLHGPQGGGRNIGEACHMYDVFRSITGAPVRSITASAIDPGSLPYNRNDNFCATLTYKEGSVANLVYTALGPKEGLPKERIEVFCDGQAYVVDDYQTLIRAGDGKVLWQSDKADKGHFEELSLLGDAIAAGTDSPIALEELVETTAVALHIEDLIHGRSNGDGSE